MNSQKLLEHSVAFLLSVWYSLQTHKISNFCEINPGCIHTSLNNREWQISNCENLVFRLIFLKKQPNSC